MNDVESPKFDKNELLANMVVRQFWVSWQKFSKNNQERLAKMSKVPGKEEKYVGSLEQNNRIRDRILKNDMLPLHEYTEVIKQFSTEQTTALQAAFSDAQINIYMSNLTTQQIAKFKLLTPQQLVAFLDAEMTNVKNKKANIAYKNNWTNVNEKTNEQMVVLEQLGDVEKRIDDLINKHPGFERLRINKKTWKLQDIKMQNALQVYAKNFAIENKTTYDKILASRGKKWADDAILTMYRIETLHSLEFQSQMDVKTKAEYNALVIEYYEVNQKIGIEVLSSTMQAIYEDAKQYVVEEYTKNDAYSTLLKNINSAQVITTYFDDHKKTTELVSEWMKDKSYYTKLLLWYPAFDTQTNDKKISDYIQYLDDDMKIKENTPDKEKEIITEFLPKIKQQGKIYEDKLLNKTNALMQNTAIDQCIVTLQKYMDVNISEKDNAIKQMQMTENSDAVSSDLVLHINGTLNGKKIALSYNLLTGKVSYKSFLHKKTDTDQSPLTLGAWNEENQVPLITLPKFGDFVESAEHSDYYKLISDAETIDEYGKKFTEGVQNDVQKNMDNDMDIQKDMLKKFIIKDMITQNIFSLAGRSMDTSPSWYILTPNGQSQSYAFYNFMYKSLEYYSMGSIDQLQLFQSNINTLLQYRQEPRISQSPEILMQRKNENQEMFALQMITNRTIIPNTNNITSDQWPETNLQSFFKCFEKQTWGIHIVDVEMMGDYFKAAAGTNKEDNTIGKRKRNQSFITMVNSLDSKISGDQASVELDAQLKMA